MRLKPEVVDPEQKDMKGTEMKKRTEYHAQQIPIDEFTEFIFPTFE